MTKAADTGDIVPTASVLARGASRDYKPHFSPTNAAKAIPANMIMTSGQSISSRSCFPLLSISGVRASGSVRGLNWYVLPACPETHSKYRLRKAVRAALQGFVATVADWRQREVRS